MPRRSLESKHSEPVDDKRDPQLKLLEADSPAVFVRLLALKTNELVQASSPWWHILNIPFQIVCILLVIDHPHALLMLPDALHTLRSVADHYATGTAKEAYGIAVFLVNQQRERRLQAVRCLETALQGRESRDRDIFPADYNDDQLFVEDLL